MVGLWAGSTIQYADTLHQQQNNRITQQQLHKTQQQLQHTLNQLAQSRAATQAAIKAAAQTIQRGNR